ncbi:MAG TPA: isoprenylcysteine carboxylmethyltransferase family protein [bacterium]|nr:isoprenylcysteine carboxylmethyltransferase family protein [bacterium]HQI48079.1 isoprenylcysteine carboxylmethyltransferase family protein [bacterium]HQJ63303.1 isoprenylcysteine carboxylmethyltransferase family protein [bacterium]
MAWRETFFKYRSFTPIPLIIAALILADTKLWTFFSGLLVAFFGEGIRLWSVRYAGSATRTTGEVGADVLVTDGPYGHLRNPLYLGNFLLSLGILIMAWPWMPWLMLIFILLFGLQYGAIISLEEDFLRNKFGAVYAEYEQHVPSILPRRTSWGKGLRQPTSLRKALRTERNSLQSFTVVTILILLRWWLF